METHVATGNVALEDLSSLDYLLYKTWRIYPFSRLQQNVTEASFMNNIEFTIKQHFHRYSMFLGNMQLQRVLIHEIVGVEGFDYSVAYYLRFLLDGKPYELRCCVFANSKKQNHLQNVILIKSKRKVRESFLDWFQQYYDVMIDTTKRKYSPYQMVHLCNKLYDTIQPKEDNENEVLASFTLPSCIDAIRRIRVKMPVHDINGIIRNCDGEWKCSDVLLHHLSTVLSVEKDICNLEEVETESGIVTKDGRLKFAKRVWINDMLLDLSRSLYQ